MTGGTPQGRRPARGGANPSRASGGRAQSERLGASLRAEKRAAGGGMDAEGWRVDGMDADGDVAWPYSATALRAMDGSVRRAGWSEDGASGASAGRAESCPTNAFFVASSSKMRSANCCCCCCFSRVRCCCCCCYLLLLLRCCCCHLLLLPLVRAH